MSKQQNSSVRDNLFKQAEDLGELKKQIEASEMPSEDKERLISGIDAKLVKLAEAINGLLRN